MANSTLIQLRSDSRTQMKIDPNAKMISNPTMNDFVNISMDRVQRDFGFDLRFNKASLADSYTASGTQEYLLPDNFVRFDLIKVNNANLDETDRADILKRVNEFQTGNPREYYLTGDSYGLNPIPNSAYLTKVEYIKKFDLLVADDDISELPQDFDDLIAKYSAYQAFATIPRYRAEAEEKLTDYQRALSLLRYKYIVRENMPNIMI